MSLLQDLAVEVAFPRCAISRLNDADSKRNAKTMIGLRSGGANRSRCAGYLTAGSRAEGLSMEDDWGHPSADQDIMLLLGGPLGVHVPGGPLPPEFECLVYHPEGCPPGYCRLEVIDVRSVRKEIQENTDNLRQRLLNVIKVQRCVCRDASGYWLDTYQTVRAMKVSGEVVSGPASQPGWGLSEFITTLVCSGPHPDLEQEFRVKPHGQWPPAGLLEDILQLPMLLVLVGHKGSPDFKRQARISLSLCELKLIRELSESIRQGYIACKYILKKFLAAYRGQTKDYDGRSRVGSYHIKTVFLHFLHKRPLSMLDRPFLLFIDLLHELDHHLQMKKLPHYFLAQCDLLETVDSEERRIARRAIHAILSDPLAAILTSPTKSIRFMAMSPRISL